MFVSHSFSLLGYRNARPLQMKISCFDFTQIHETVSLNLNTPTDTEVHTYTFYIIIN